MQFCYIFASLVFRSHAAEGSSSPCSLYMKELQNFMTRSAADYFCLYHSTELLREEYLYHFYQPLIAFY